MLAQRRGQYLAIRATPVLIPLLATSREELLELRKRSPRAAFHPHIGAKQIAKATAPK